MVVQVPAQLVFSIALLYIFLGPATLAAIGTILCFIPCLVFLTKALERTESDKLKLKDSRLKLINEVLVGMKVKLLF